MTLERALAEFYTTTDIQDVLSRNKIQEIEIIKTLKGYSVLFSYKFSNEDFQYVGKASAQDEQLKSIRSDNEQLSPRLRRNLGKLETALEYAKATGKARKIYLWLKMKLM